MATPLTHHDILALVEPFTRRGRRVDLAASDRLHAKIVFQVVDRDANEPEIAVLREALQLERLDRGGLRLTRTLTTAGGLQATLVARGRDAGRLLELVDKVLPGHQLLTGPGFIISRSYTLHASDSAIMADASGWVLTDGRVQCEGLGLTLRVPATRNMSADISLSAKGPHRANLPEDFLAVMGWRWSPLLATKEGWKDKFRVRGNPQRRTFMAEQALNTVARHIAETLSRPPHQYHDRHLFSRWVVVLRRSIPTLTPIFLVLAILASSNLDFSGHQGWFVLLYHVPTLLIALSFTMQDDAKFEIPPWPRRLTQEHWMQIPGTLPHQRESTDTP
jgi:hypothetical protein